MRDDKQPQWEQALAPKRWTRREFLRRSGLATAVLALGSLDFGCGDKTDAAPLAAPAAGSAQQVAALPEVPDYRQWEDLYRHQWVWDSVVRGTHTMTNCVSGCAWNLYVKDGMVWREEQQAPYVASMEGLQDFNPRGCQKGACASSLMYSPSRIRYPLRRVGERGEGRWERISWEDAAAAVAKGIVDAIQEVGPETVVCELGPNIGAGPNSAAPLRFFRLLGAPATDSMAQIGDLFPGATITLGHGHPCGSSDDWSRSSYLVLWAFNPSATRIPDAHFLYEARYRGARLVVVSPDYNNSAIHADLWLNPKPGTDAALALSAAQVIIEEKLYKADFVLEQTDLPLLVRTDTRRFVRAADFEDGGSEEAFFLWDEATGSAVPAPGSDGAASLALQQRRPSLEFAGSIKIKGATVPVRTVFSLLREYLDAECRPEKLEAVTGVSAGTVRTFARQFASAPAALILAQYGSSKFLHADLAQRAQILMASLTGNFGRVGGGWRTGGFFTPEGFGLLAIQEKLDLLNLGMFGAKAYLNPKDADAEFARYLVPGTIFHAVHGGLEKISGDQRHGDAAAPRSGSDYLKEALEKKWFPLHPPADVPPRVLVSVFGNVLRHSRANKQLREHLLPKTRLLVDVNFRMSETGRWSDIILPAAFWYEKTDLKYLVSLVPYLHLGDRAVAPLGDAKPEWEIFARLAEAVAAEARQRQLAPYTDIAERTRDARNLGEAFTDSGRFGPGDEEKALRFVLQYSTAAGGATLEDMRKEGARRFATTGRPGAVAGYYSDYSPNEPLVPHRHFTEKKQTWPTLTGRQQFYVDHPWFLECGEALPVHKPPPMAGGNYPLTLGGGHTRWSIHSQWRDQKALLNLQRGEPVVYMNAADAEARGIADHDLVRVHNDLGSFTLRSKVASSVRPGQVIVYHAWEPYQFRGGQSDHAIIPSPFKGTGLAGGYGQLTWSHAHWEPNQIDRDTRVNVERA